MRSVYLKLSSSFGLVNLQSFTIKISNQNAFSFNLCCIPMPDGHELWSFVHDTLSSPLQPENIFFSHIRNALLPTICKNTTSHTGVSCSLTSLKWLQFKHLVMNEQRSGFFRNMSSSRPRNLACEATQPEVASMPSHEPQPKPPTQSDYLQFFVNALAPTSLS